MQHHRKSAAHLLTLCITAVLAAGMIGLTGPERAEAASKWTVSPSGRTITVGSHGTFRSNRSVRWKAAGKKGIIRITKKSSRAVTVRGEKAGTAYLKAVYGRKTKKIRVRVVAKQLKAVSTRETIGVKNYCTVYVKSPAGADQNVSYSSSDRSVATVSASGLVTGVSPGTVTITVKSGKKGIRNGSVRIKVAETVNGTITLEAGMTDEAKYPAGKTARMWIPIPQTDRDQIVSDVRWEVNEDSVSKVEKTKDSAGNRGLYIEWKAAARPQDRRVKTSFHVSRQAIVRPAGLASREKGTVDRKKMGRYLKETKRSGSLTEGIVKETADGIVRKAGAKTVYQKAYAIYDWVCENLRRDSSTPGIGSGEVVYILNHRDQGIGKCTDVNAVFVALCRAEGIPARSVYGFKLDAMKKGDQHVQKCKPQYYLPGYGWAEADASAVLKEIIGKEDAYRGKNAPNGADWKALKDAYWGRGQAQWMMVSQGGDITLSPRQEATSAVDRAENHLGILNEDGTLNYFMYPYAEYDGQYLSCYGNAKGFIYTYSFAEVVDDCGC